MTQDADRLDSIYNQLLLEHWRNPRHAGLPERCDVRAEGDNPLCGDRVRLGLSTLPASDETPAGSSGASSRVIAAIGHDSEGCALSVAAASIMAGRVEGRTLAETAALCRRVLSSLEQMSGAEESRPRVHEHSDHDAELAALARAGRSAFRQRCVTLPWQALGDALASILHERDDR